MLSFQWFKKHKLCLSGDFRPPDPQPKLTLNCLYNPGLTLSLPIYVKTNKWDDAHQGFCYLVLGIAAHKCALWLFDYIFLIHLNSMRVIIKRDKSPRRPVNREKKKSVLRDRQTNRCLETTCILISARASTSVLHSSSCCACNVSFSCCCCLPNTFLPNSSLTQLKGMCFSSPSEAYTCFSFMCPHFFFLPRPIIHGFVAVIPTSLW